MTSKEMMKLLENDRWYLVHVKGSHHHYKHPKKTYHRLLKKAGDTEQEALLIARECLELHLYGIEEDKEEIPNASHIIEINHTKNQAIVLIKANIRATRDEMNNKAVKKTLTIPKWLNEEAMNRKINFSAVLKAALKDELGIR